MPNTIEITEIVNTLEITGEGETSILAVTETVVNVIAVAEQGPQGEPGPQGEQGETGPEGPPGSVGPGGGLLSVEDDPAPTLGGDLDLNSFQIRGTISNDDFLIDCGLI